MGVVQLPADLARTIRGLGSRIGALERRVTRIAAGGEPWHVVGAAGEVAFESGASNYNPGWVPASYYRDGAGQVHVRAMVALPQAAGAWTVFTLPEGYRPSHIFMVAAQSDQGFVRVDLQGDGALKVYNPAPLGWCCFTAHFRAEN